MNLCWLTDIHLNFIDAAARTQFYQTIIKSDCDAVLISGDIAEAPVIAELLNEMVKAIQKPIYFVLGNHDYYRGEIDNVKSEMTALSKINKYLYWLPACGPQSLEREIVLIGQDGWADGRYGDYTNSQVVLNDSRMIADLFHEKIISKYRLLEKMQLLADDDATQLEKNLHLSLEINHPKKIIVLTHIPPFKEACMYQGNTASDDYLPFFASKASGDVLLRFAKKYPAIECLVLCGHTHEPAEIQPLKNLTVRVGIAEYGQPSVECLVT